MNVSALIAVLVFAAVLLSIFGALYLGAWRSYERGELAFDGIRLLRWAMLGHVVLYAILAATALLAP